MGGRACEFLSERKVVGFWLWWVGRLNGINDGNDYGYRSVVGNHINKCIT